jgi:hypothetical protein
MAAFFASRYDKERRLFKLPAYKGGILKFYRELIGAAGSVLGFDDGGV